MTGREKPSRGQPRRALSPERSSAHRGEVGLEDGHQPRRCCDGEPEPGGEQRMCDGTDQTSVAASRARFSSGRLREMTRWNPCRRGVGVVGAEVPQPGRVDPVRTGYVEVPTLVAGRHDVCGLVGRGSVAHEITSRLCRRWHLAAPIRWVTSAAATMPERRPGSARSQCRTGARYNTSSPRVRDLRTRRQERHHLERREIEVGRLRGSEGLHSAALVGSRPPGM